MKVIIRYIFRGAVLLLVIGLGMGGCDLFSPVEEPVFDNPKDPNSPNAQAPTADIKFPTTDTIMDDAILIEWGPDSSEEGITENLEYQYRLIGPNENAGDIQFSDPTTSTSVAYEYLTESFADGEYTFQVRALSAEVSDLVQQEPTEYNFIINAIPDYGAAFSPRRMTNVEGNIYATELFLQGIESSDGLTAIQLEVNYPFSDLEVDSVAIYDEENFLSAASGDLVSFDDAPTSGTRLINIGILGGDASQLSGYGAVAKVYFTVTSTGSGPYEISLGDETTFYYQNNSTETFNTLDRAVITD